MNLADKNKWQVRVAALVIFVLGFAAGALSLNLYRKYRSTDETAGSVDGTELRGGRRFERMLDRLSLDASQRAQMEEIMRETRAELMAIRKDSRPRVFEIRKRSRERMQQVLNADQWQQLQEMMKKNRERRSQPRPQADDEQ
jgi:Spy/CpxP family protein refolding chaperone